MQLATKLQLLLGPVRPFILGKLRDTIRVRFAMSKLKRTGYEVTAPSIKLQKGVAPLPSLEFAMQHAQEVLAAARNHAKGVVEAYGITSWKVGEANPSCKDVRGVHELSRMHSWPTYALAQNLGTDAAYSTILFHELATYKAYYKPPSGVHWLFAMGIGLRLHNMLVAADWVARTQELEPEQEKMVVQMAYTHARVLYARRESAGGMATSHYLANLLGLLSAGVYLQEDDWCKGLGHFAAKELSEQLLLQFYPDGMNFEASTGYHVQSLDIILQAEQLISATVGLQQYITNDWRNRVQAAVSAYAELKRASRPLIGDNDDGMAMKLMGYAPHDVYMLDVAKKLGYIVTGSNRNHVVFEHFGLSIYHKAHYSLVIRNGQVGQYNKGGHAHNDQNAIVLVVHGAPVVVDPGSTYYSGDALVRNQNRSVSAHATVDALTEQYSIPEDSGEGLFWLLTPQGMQHRIIEEGENHWVGMFSKTGQNGYRHTRTIQLSDTQIHIKDECSKTPFTVRYPLVNKDMVTIEFTDKGVVKAEHIGNWSPQFGTQQQTVVVETQSSTPILNTVITILPRILAHED